MTDQAKDVKVRTAAMLATLENQRNAALTEVVHVKAQAALLADQLTEARKTITTLEARVAELTNAEGEKKSPNGHDKEHAHA